MELEHYAPDASIILIGVRGSGRSTLALLAANFLGFRVVDIDVMLRKLNDKTEQACTARDTQDESRCHQLNLLHMALEANPTRAVIVCGSSCVLQTGQQLVLKFGKTHPVIYIIRDADEVAKYLRHPDTATISEIMDSGSPTFRKLSNFEFYNISDDSFAKSFDKAQVTGPPSPSLVLKRVECDFLKLVASSSRQISPRIGHAHTVSSLAPVELRPHTYSLFLTVSQVASLGRRLSELDIIADTVELSIGLHEILDEQGNFSDGKATWISKILYTLRRNVRLPIIYHVCYAAEPFSTSEQMLRMRYLQAVRHGLRLGVEFVTLDLHLSTEELQTFLENKCYSKLIGHFHDESPEPDAWDGESRKNLLLRSQELGFSFVRFSQRATSRADNISIQRFLQHAQHVTTNTLRIIAYNTGPMGRMSCFLNGILSPVTHPFIREQLPRCEGDAEADWMLTVPEALDALYASCKLDPLFFGIVGVNVHSSLSPFMHNMALSYCGMPHVYKTFQYTFLKDFAPILQDPSFGGASITNPFKAEIIPLLDSLSPAASAIGAVNTIIPLRSHEPGALLDREKAGRILALYGENTDWIGIHTCIRRNLTPINAMKGRTIGLVLGAGGMAHAAVYSMIYLGVEKIYVWNRTKVKAESMAQRFSGKTYAMPGPSTSRLPGGVKQRQFGPSQVKVISSMGAEWPGQTAPNVIVSCIPDPRFQLPEQWLSSKTGGVFIELAYIPMETPILKQLRHEHPRWLTVDGLHAFPEQGIAQFELFTGRKAPRNLMRSIMHSKFLELEGRS
ncbi:type I 3-dehydroquinase-domain-containing protein [Xylaria curta]|nr:type I 3-dehydroquinase-domain-containing protein [Xylaria curta]